MIKWFQNTANRQMELDGLALLILYNSFKISFFS